MPSNLVERHPDRRNGTPNQRPLGRRKKVTNNRVKPTNADRKQAKQKRQESRDAYAVALAAAQKVIWDQAEALREEFGKHDTNHYFEEIIQRSHMKVNERSTSRWNAFCKLEIERRNNGMFCSLRLQMFSN
jgi:hypothetical protein